MTPREYANSGISTVEMLDGIHVLIERAKSDHPGVSDDDLVQFETAVSEIATNVIRHGRPAGQVRYEFLLTVRPDRIAATLSDSGAAFEPVLSAPMPDPGDNLDDLQEGGRGLVLARDMLHELIYRRDGDRNIWTMARQLRA